MNVIENFQTVLNWSKDHGVACVSETHEQPPTISTKKKGKSRDNEVPSASPGLYLTLCKETGKKMALWLPAYGAKQVWSVALGKDGNNYVAGTVEILHRGELVDFLDKQAESILRAA
jgi:hypothetical protein